jgi:hypothetical protein
VSTVPVCAHLCPVLAKAVAEGARGKGVPERVGRIGLGLSPEYLPITSLAHPSLPRPGVACTSCGHVYDGPGAITAARECADLDTGTTD